MMSDVVGDDGEEERKYLCKIEKSHNELVQHYYK